MKEQHVFALDVQDIAKVERSGQHGPLELVLIELLDGIAKRSGRSAVLMRIDFPKRGPTAVEFRVKRLTRFGRFVWRLLRSPVPLWEVLHDGRESLH